jgi:predicted RNA-binding Zn ribbon-like protein
MGNGRKSKFSFIGGDLAIDFLNTEVVRGGERVDLLRDAAALAEWLAAAGLLSRGHKISVRVFDDVRRLRASLRRIVASMADGKPVDGEDVRTIDAVLRRGQGALALGSSKSGRFRLEFEARPDVAADPRYRIARAAASFLAQADANRLHACGGAGCILFFYDTSKSGTRRWCDKAGCGNRANVAAHYRRARQSSAR